MKETLWYYDELIKLLAQKLQIANYEVEDIDILKNKIEAKDPNILSSFNQFKDDYEAYNNYYNEKSKDGTREEPFSIDEMREYNRLSEKMNKQREDLLKCVQ